MHHFVTEICTREHDSVTKWCTVGYGTGALWDVFKSKIFRSWVDIQYALYPIKYAVVLSYSSWLCVIVLVKSACTIYLPGLILGLRPANERRRYKVTPSLIGWEQTSNQPWFTHSIQGCFTITRVIVWLLDSFTVLLLSHKGRHLPAVRAVQEDCQWPLKNSHRSREPVIHRMWEVPQSTYRSANHSARKTAN